jgi:hypothetical protein
LHAERRKADRGIDLHAAKKLMVGKAPGVNGIVTKVLVECAEMLCRPLLSIFHLSLGFLWIGKELT